MLETLSRSDRLHLMKFVCALAWADLEVQDGERAFVDKMIEKLGLEDERPRIQRWLKTPPPPEEVDPTRVPREHRQIFLDTARAVFNADGMIDPKERESFELLEQLLV